MISLAKFKICSIIFMSAMFCSCNSQTLSVAKENTENKLVHNTNDDDVSFEEMRRINFKIDLDEVSVLNEFDEILNLYQKLHNPKFSRAYPIPTLQEGESLIVLKPTLKKIKYGDIEIINIQNKNETIFIDYREIESWEYERDQVSNPILIIKISEKFKNIKLTSKP